MSSHSRADNGDRLSAAARGYGARWRKERLEYLARHPFCVFCAKKGRTVAATVVDHIRPHKGDQRLFWARSNWQALCRLCHSNTKQAIEAGNAPTGLDGWPEL
jgi:5-methylcytosine-specific restriction protein A